MDYMRISIPVVILMLLSITLETLGFGAALTLSKYRMNLSGMEENKKTPTQISRMSFCWFYAVLHLSRSFFEFFAKNLLNVVAFRRLFEIYGIISFGALVYYAIFFTEKKVSIQKPRIIFLDKDCD